MYVVVIEAPEPLVELDLAKKHLREDGDDWDDLIEAYIAAVSSHIDGPEGWLGRSVGEQLLELRADALCGPVLLPYGPVTAVEGFDYMGPDGTELSLAEVSYVLEAANVSPAYGSSWPSVRGDAGCVRIQYRAGYASPPKPIQVAVLMIVGELFANREESTAEIKISGPAEALLAPYRCWWP